MSSINIAQHYRYCPRCASPNPDCGSIPFRCAQCGFANFFGPVAAVGGLIVNLAGELLLVRRARDPGRGKWGLPGGFIDHRESVEQALARETFEETQLVISQAEYLMSHPNCYDYRGIVAPVIDLFYRCRVESVDALHLAEDELDYHLWTIPRAEHLENMAFESNRIAIEYWMSRSRETT